MLGLFQFKIFMKKWLFQSQEYVWFLFGAISGFGINLVTWKLSELPNWFGILILALWIALFFIYKNWIATKDEFDFFITHSHWEFKLFDNTQTWICEDTDEYQLVEWNVVVEKFQEEWTRIFPDNNNNASYQLFLKRNGIIVREFTWVSCDGGRVWMPIPERKNHCESVGWTCQMEYFFQKNSLNYRMLLKIWVSWSETSFDRLFERAKIYIK